MDPSQLKNLDQLCAEYGYQLAKEVSQAVMFDAKKAEKLITEALETLQEQGLYAFALFCDSRGNAERLGAEKIKKKSQELLGKKLQLISESYDFFEELRKKLLIDLDKLMFAIQVLEKSLIYAKFHAKAMEGSQSME